MTISSKEMQNWNTKLQIFCTGLSVHALLYIGKLLSGQICAAFSYHAGVKELLLLLWILCDIPTLCCCTQLKARLFLLKSSILKANQKWAVLFIYLLKVSKTFSVIFSKHFSVENVKFVWDYFHRQYFTAAGWCVGSTQNNSVCSL